MEQHHGQCGNPAVAPGFRDRRIQQRRGDRLRCADHDSQESLVIAGEDRPRRRKQVEGDRIRELHAVGHWLGEVEPPVQDPFEAVGVKECVDHRLERMEQCEQLEIEDARRERHHEPGRRIEARAPPALENGDSRDERDGDPHRQPHHHVRVGIVERSSRRKRNGLEDGHHERPADGNPRCNTRQAERRAEPSSSQCRRGDRASRCKHHGGARRPALEAIDLNAELTGV